MFKWLRNFINYYDEVEAENLKAGIIHGVHPYAGVYTYVDKEQYKKYINDKQRTLSKDNRQTKS